MEGLEAVTDLEKRLIHFLFLYNISQCTASADGVSTLPTGRRIDVHFQNSSHTPEMYL